MPQAINIIWTLSRERCGLLNHKSEGKGEAFEKWVRVSIPLSYLGKGQSTPSWTRLSLQEVPRVRGKSEGQVKADLHANSDTNQ